MLNTKEMVSGKNIDLSKYNLGIIRQPKVDDFMGELDVIDFAKPFYMERLWRVNGLFDENDLPFTLFCMSVSKNPELEILLMIALRMIYVGLEVTTAKIDDSIKILIHDDDKAVAFIDDSNFDMLCKVVVGMMYFEEPKKTKEENIDGSEEDIALFAKYEKEYDKKHKDNNEMCFEEKVREVIHMKNCFYDDIKNLTVWQLEDFYRSCMFMDNYNKEFQKLITGKFKMKEVKNWQSQTKISRNAK